MKSIITIFAFLLTQSALASVESDACKRKEVLYAKYQTHEANLAKAAQGDASINTSNEQAQMKKLSAAYKKAEQLCQD